jgi:queuine tRNA-ribosyltransferase
MDCVSMFDIPEIPVTQLPDDFTDEPGRLMLDVREYDEWEAGHVRGAIHIPLTEVAARLDEIDPDAELFVICHSGGRSERVLQYLLRNGYDGSGVAGGMLSWVQSGKPVESGR